MVALDAVTRQNLSALQTIASQMAQVQTRLATGRRVNSAADDPAAFFTAANLNSRATHLNGLLDGVAAAQKAVAAASQGIDAIQDLLESAQSLANQALQSPTNFVKVTGTNSTAFTTSSVIATTSGSSTRLRAGDTVTVSDGTTTATYTAANGDTIQTLLNAVNNTANLKVTASLNANGQLQFSATTNVNVTIGGTTNGSGTLSSVLALSAGTTNFTPAATRASLAQQFDALRTQIDQAVADATYNGVNLLGSGTLTVTFNESGSSKLTLNGLQISASSLGLAASSAQFQTDADVNTALANVSAAMAALQGYSGVLGSNTAVLDTRTSFTKALVSTLESGADTLLASDSNEDSALLLALQTRQQVAASLLAMTQGANQAALRLFGL